MFQFIDWRSVELMISVGKRVAGPLVGLCIWVKPTKGMGAPWRSQHELICVFRCGAGKSKDNVKLGAFGRNRSNVWPFDAPTGFGPERAKLKIHPTCKNESMIAEAIMDCTDRGDVILDAFLGSGTTVLASHRTHRIGVGIELDPHYVDLAIRRVAEEVGQPAMHQSGKTFDQLSVERNASAEPDHGRL
jgi:DNA modification methylase